MFKLLKILPLLLIVSCAPIKVNLPEENSQVVKSYLKVCGACHNPPFHPTEHTPKEWEVTVDVMSRHMTSIGVEYSPREIQKILKYLKKHARRS